MAEALAGCLLGQCLGDAFGLPVEGHPAEVCAPYVAEVVRSGTLRARPGLPLGQYSDDSQLARELLQSYRERGGFDPADYAQRITAIFAEERIVGRGRATEAAAARLRAGVPWDEAGAPPPSAGNGSAMRAAPVGLLFADPERIVAVAVDQGRITHRDPRCSAGAVAIAGAASLARGAIDIGDVTRQLARWVESLDPILATAIERDLPRWLQRAPERVVEAVRAVGRDHDDGWPGISPFVTGSVLWSLYAFLRSPDDYLEVIATAIAVGGDVDTTAAMAGGICGARCGLAGLPDAAKHVQDLGTWRYPELVELAGAC